MTNTYMSLRDAAQAVIDRWETPLWKDAPATAVFIADLRDALARDAGDMFEFWWADHAPNATQEEAWAEWCSLMRPGPVVAAPPAAQAEGWRLIATAPKDGTYLLLWEQYSTNPFVGCWAFGAWTVSHEHVDAEGGWDGANVVDALSMPITHWMPIPAPPTSAEGVEHG